jgi:catechol 2,3-dioxygenase
MEPLPSTAAAPAPTTAVLPPGLRLGAAHLVVTDVDRSVAWYGEVIGLRTHRHDAAGAELGDGRAPALVLHEDPAARTAGRHAGLYHVALLLASRAELARSAVRLGATGTEIQGASDHGTHEAIYLADPDGNGLELAADRPRASWPPDLGYAGGPGRLAFDDLLAAVAGEEPAPRVGEGLTVGHLHLHVGDIDRALAFYRDVLGFELRAHLGTAAFVSAGGYHHHLGINVWQGRGVPGAPAHTVGLREWAVELPSPADVMDVRGRIEAAGIAVEPRPGGLLVRDPWGTALVVVAAPAGGPSPSAPR